MLENEDDNKIKLSLHDQYNVRFGPFRQPNLKKRALKGESERRVDKETKTPC
jgi:hypothetical protein